MQLTSIDVIISLAYLIEAGGIRWFFVFGRTTNEFVYLIL